MRGISGSLVEAPTGATFGSLIHPQPNGHGLEDKAPVQWDRFTLPASTARWALLLLETSQEAALTRQPGPTIKGISGFSEALELAGTPVAANSLAPENTVLL